MVGKSHTGACVICIEEGRRSQGRAAACMRCQSAPACCLAAAVRCQCKCAAGCLNSRHCYHCTYESQEAPFRAIGQMLQ
jgi:hypothetical protein